MALRLGPTGGLATNLGGRPLEDIDNALLLFCRGARLMERYFEFATGTQDFLGAASAES